MNRNVLRRISLVVVSMLIIGLINAVYPIDVRADADLNQTHELDSLEAIVASYFFVGDIIQEDANNDKIVVKTPIPLYDIDGSIVAYYVKFEPEAYAIVYNSDDNPAAIEFGVGFNEDIDSILDSNDEARVVYTQPGTAYEMDDLSSMQTSNVLSLTDYYPDLSVRDDYLSNWVSETKEYVIQNEIIQIDRGDGDYGFFFSYQMPSGNYTSDSVTQASLVDWAVTSDYNNIASNHCGATAGTNLALYFYTRGFTNLKVNNSKYDTFVAVHAIVGNGPVYTLDSYVKTYFSNRGYTLNSSSVSSTSGLVTAVSMNRPCLTLLVDGLTSWHWIVTVGWRQYTSSGDFYMRICDGWNNTINRFYKVSSGSLWFSSKCYWVTV